MSLSASTPSLRTPRQAALRELDLYARDSVGRSKRQYAKHGTLHDKAAAAFSDPSIWDKPWMPDDLDVGDARLHPVYQGWTRAQQNAWNQLRWGLEYGVVANGERQIVVLNKWAVRGYQDVLPSVVELQDRESFEEVDHIDAFQVGLDALHNKYMPHIRGGLDTICPSGFRSDRLNRLVRHAIGVVGQKVLGRNFPTFFFLIRGLKTHCFKPFENAIAGFDGAPDGVRQVSHLHRLDESRHMATALYIARLSNDILETLPEEGRLLLTKGVQLAFPRQRMAEARYRYWRLVLDQAIPFQAVQSEDKDALMAHIVSRTKQNMSALHERQTRLTRQANKRLVESSGLDPQLKQMFVQALRSDPHTAKLVDAVELEAS